MLNNVKQGTGSYGYNAATGEYGDMIAMGILDPTKVTRTALQNAASNAYRNRMEFAANPVTPARFCYRPAPVYPP